MTMTRDKRVSVDAEALRMVLNALRRDAEEGRAARGKMADELEKTCSAIAERALEPITHHVKLHCDDHGNGLSDVLKGPFQMGDIIRLDPVQTPMPQEDTGTLIAAAEKYAETYDGDERQGVKTDVLNAFYHGAHYASKRALEPQDVSAVIKDCADQSFAELGRIAMRFVDRAGDVHPGIDDAERICRDFHQAMSDAIDAQFEGRALEPQGQALPEDDVRTYPLFCRSCGADRSKEDCKGSRSNCSLRGEAQHVAVISETVGDMTAYAQSIAARASQLALPAGPVPELKRIHAAMTNCDMYGEDGAAKGVMVPQSLLDQFEQALPAVAQPVADEREAFELTVNKVNAPRSSKSSECYESRELTILWEGWKLRAMASDLLSPAAQAIKQPVLDERDAEISRLNAIINTPQSGDFLRAVSTEAEHQRQRWGSSHDAGKAAADWFWLVGYLAGKALHSHNGGDLVKAEHHIITTAAALMNWHMAMFGKTDMRPGIDGDAALCQPAEEGGKS
ncbi:hypothetical protein [Herbaspirillum huttiense]|uniref:hypothetical protein n=1 Tax=Herbaspirillum huttiense TaxID=863372 RepID=UPI0031D5D7F8